MTTYTVVGGRLHADGHPVPFRASPNVGGAIRPSLLVMHYTAGGWDGSVSWLCNPQSRASAHLVIDRDGKVVQLVPFDRRAWHAGRASWGGTSDVNGMSIGIELVNLGDLSRAPAGASARIDPRRKQRATHKAGGPAVEWEIYDSRQIDTAQAIGRAICDHYRIGQVVGHDDVSPGRKTDPGPLFPWATFRAGVLGLQRDPDPLPVQQGEPRTGPADRPAARSRTMAGVGLAGLGATASEAGDQLVAAVAPLAAVAPDTVAVITAAVKIAGVAALIGGLLLAGYARWDDAGRPPLLAWLTGRRP